MPRGSCGRHSHKGQSQETKRKKRFNVQRSHSEMSFQQTAPFSCFPHSHWPPSSPAPIYPSLAWEVRPVSSKPEAPLRSGSVSRSGLNQHPSTNINRGSMLTNAGNPFSAMSPSYGFITQNSDPTHVKHHLTQHIQ